MTDIFTALRESPRIWQAPAGGAAGELFLRVATCADGAYVEAVDAAGKPWPGSCALAHGARREALKALEAIRQKEEVRFTWGRTMERVYLAEHEHLVPLLAESGCLVNRKFQPVTLEDAGGRICLALTRDGEFFDARARLVVDDHAWEDFEVWSGAYVLAEETRLFRIRDLGGRCGLLPRFNERFPAGQLEQFLSLLYSTLDGVKVEWEDFRETAGPLRTVEPCVVFEEVDDQGNLKLRIGLAMAGFDNQFVESYELSRAVTVNDMERTLVVGDVVYKPVGDCLRTVDSALRKAARQSGGQYYYQDENFFLVDSECAQPFLADALPLLLSGYPCLGAGNLTRYRIRTSRPRLRIERVGSGIDFLSADIVLEIDDQSVTLEEALKHFRKQVYIPLNDGSRAVINPDYLRKLERIFRRKRGEQTRISFFDLPVLEELIEDNERDRLRQIDAVGKIRAELNATKIPPLPSLNAELRPYQKTGFVWLHRLHKAGLGGCLADDMGLGKTLQALAILRATAGKRTPPSLLIMPRTLLFNWQTEIARFAPDLTAAVHHGAGRNLEQALKSALVLTTYGTVRADIEALQEVRFHYIILDESQNIKNPVSQTARAALLLKGTHRLALSGTPVENNLSELYSLFRFLNPSMFESLQAFNHDYGQPIAKCEDRQAMLELRAKIAPFILRRTKKDVLAELPDKVEQVLYVEMDKPQAELYESRRRFHVEMLDGEIRQNGVGGSQFAILQAFTELRQIASTPESRTDGTVLSAKREMVIDELAEATANGHKCLLFANFLGAIESLSDDLNTAGIGHLVMTGATRDREALVKRFQNDDSVRVFLMTLKTGGVGLNLTAADYVFIYDPWWNLAAETQAVDRTHRIGQKNTVFTYKLVTRNTIEEKMLKLQERKREIFDNLIGADAASLKSFSMEDIQFALGVET